MSDFLGEKRVDRRLVRIPRDQQTLLARPDAWHAATFMNLPPTVLQDVKDFHIRKQQSPAKERQSSQSEGPLPSSKVQQLQPSLQLARNGSQDGETGSDGTEDEESGGATPAPWSPSPARPSRRFHVVNEPPPDSSPTPLPPRPNKTNTVAQTTAAFPSSSLGDDADLEMEVPGAITDVVLPPQERASRMALDPTPPSAQIVPSTDPSLVGVPSPQNIKRRRLMKVPNFGGPRQLEKRELSSGIVPPRPATTQLIGSSDSLPSGSTSSGISVETPTPESVDPLAAHHSETGQSEASEQPVNRTPTPPSPVAVSGRAATTDSFATFTGAYPSYTEGLGTFVRGVICLQSIVQKRQLPSFLFDDFIRVFSSEFIGYIQGLDGDEQPMTAVQWYNEYVHNPTFTKSIVSKDNVDDILNEYKDEVELATLSLHPGSQGEEVEETATSHRITEDSQTQVQSREDGAAAMRDAHEDVQASYVLSYQPSAKSRNEVDASGAEVPTATPQSRERVTGEQNSASAIPETIPDTVVRSRPGVSPILQAKSSPTGSLKRRRAPEDPQSRSKRYRKFLLERWIPSSPSSSSAG